MYLSRHDITTDQSVVKIRYVYLFKLNPLQIKISIKKGKPYTYIFER